VRRHARAPESVRLPLRHHRPDPRRDGNTRDAGDPRRGGASGGGDPRRRFPRVARPRRRRPAARPRLGAQGDRRHPAGETPHRPDAVPRRPAPRPSPGGTARDGRRLLRRPAKARDGASGASPAADRLFLDLRTAGARLRRGRHAVHRDAPVGDASVRKPVPQSRLRRAADGPVAARLPRHDRVPRAAARRAHRCRVRRGVPRPAAAANRRSRQSLRRPRTPLP